MAQRFTAAITGLWSELASAAEVRPLPVPAASAPFVPQGRGAAAVSQDPSSLVIAQGLVTVIMSNPSTTSVFPWPIGSVFQFHGLTSSSGDVSLLNDTPFTILTESDPANSQQPCKPGLECVIKFAPAVPQPPTGTYTVTAGTGQASALITATMNVIVNSVLTQVSGSTNLTVQ